MKIIEETFLITNMSCNSAEKTKFNVSFFLLNEKKKEIKLIKYSMDQQFPTFNKGEKLYISQSGMYLPVVERIVRDKLKYQSDANGGEFSYSEEFINKVIQTEKDFEKEHLVHYIKIVRIYKNLLNIRDTKTGENVLTYDIEYYVKDCTTIKEKIQNIFKKLLRK